MMACQTFNKLLRNIDKFKTPLVINVCIKCCWQAMLSYDRPEDLYQAVGVLYSIFHLDIDNLTLSLLSITLPSLLLQSLSTSNPTTLPLGFGSGQVPSSSSGRFLSDPRGGALAKLCVLCINLMCTVRQFAASAGRFTAELGQFRLQVGQFTWKLGQFMSEFGHVTS